jgi:preprotein translocase subunit SecD
MKSLRLVLLIALLLTSGCNFGVPVSAVTVIELKKASEADTGHLVPMKQFGTDRTIFVSRESIIQNKHISTIERTYDREDSDALLMHFTAEGSKMVAEATESYGDTMIAVVVDGQLVVALPLTSRLSKNALISGSREMIDRLEVMLTATEGSDIAN